MRHIVAERVSYLRKGKMPEAKLTDRTAEDTIGFYVAFLKLLPLIFHQTASALRCGLPGEDGS